MNETLVGGQAISQGHLGLQVHHLPSPSPSPLPCHYSTHHALSSRALCATVLCSNVNVAYHNNRWVVFPLSTPAPLPPPPPFLPTYPPVWQTAPAHSAHTAVGAVNFRLLLFALRFAKLIWKCRRSHRDSTSHSNRNTWQMQQHTQISLKYEARLNEKNKTRLTVENIVSNCD